LEILDTSLEKIDLLLADRLLYMNGERSDETHSVSSLVEEAVSFFDKGSAVKPSIILPKGDMMVTGSRITLTSALINLMNNGIKAAKAHYDEYGGNADIKVEVT
jgi:C4-dicarboxylate-specific signal transduction histidine kinase